MKINKKFVVILFALLLPLSGHTVEDFISTPLFFSEALQDYNPSIDRNSIRVSEDLSDVSQQKLANFTAKATVLNSLEGEFITYQVLFAVSEHHVNCLGTILPIDHQIMLTQPGKEYQSRSGLIYLSECDVSYEKLSDNFPHNFEIKRYVAFPKVESLPIAQATILEKYELFKGVSTENKLFQCVSNDVNAMGVPRSSVTIYEMEDHFTVGVGIGSSSTNLETHDIPIDIGEIDLGTLPWLKDNINFLMELGPKGTSTFNIVFKKDDCKILGPKETVTMMTCRADIQDPSQQTKQIKKVFLHFQTNKLIKPFFAPKEKNHLGFEESLEFNVDIEFTVDKPNKYHPIYPHTIYRNSLKYYRDSVHGQECRFASEYKSNSKEKKPGTLNSNDANFNKI